MRVIAGTARSLPLKAPKGDAIRPTTDKTKETLFNILQPYIPGCVFLDLFSGTGAIGIEALSRGAAQAYFVDQSRDAIKIIRENLAFTRLFDRAQVMQTDAFAALAALKTKKFDVIFLDPPFGCNLEKRAMELIAAYGLLQEDGILAVEVSLAAKMEYLDVLGLYICKEKEYKTHKHVFIKGKK